VLNLSTQEFHRIDHLRATGRQGPQPSRLRTGEKKKGEDKKNKKKKTWEHQTGMDGDNTLLFGEEQVGTRTDLCRSGRELAGRDSGTAQ
jgi:hypothetical protein